MYSASSPFVLFIGLEVLLHKPYIINLLAQNLVQLEEKQIRKRQ